MRKILSVIILFMLGSFITFGQQVTMKPVKFTGIDNNTSQNLDQYLTKNVDQSRATIWSSTLSSATGWTAATEPTSTLSTLWSWIADTSAASTKFKQYVHPDLYMKSPTCTQGLFYFDGITNLVNGVYGYANATLTNSTPISTIGHNAVTLKFYQLYKSFNADSALVEISNDNINWNVIDVNGTVAVNTYASGWKEFNITPWAGNKSTVWIRFRFIGPASTSSGAQYGGGYGWMIDDVSINDAPNNRIEFSDIWGGFVNIDPPFMWSGYTQMPSGQSLPVTMAASITNTGGMAQSNAVLKIKNINTGVIGVSTASIASMQVSELDTLEVDNMDTLGKTVGTFNYTFFAQSDSVTPVYFKDTLSVTVNNKSAGLFSRDNDYYNGYRRWNGVTGTSVDAYQMANLVEISTADPIYAAYITFVVGSGTTINAPVKAILYRGFGQTKTVIAESDYHFIQANEIASTNGNTPPAIKLMFNDYSGGKTKLDKDSVYFVAVQAFGGTDSIWMAVGSSKTPQPNYSMYVFDTDNLWYYYPRASAPAMIRLYTSPTDLIGIKENATSANLFQCMPNPANNSTRISYELKKTDNVSVEIYDFLGNKVKSFNEGRKNAGFYNIDVNLSDFASGTYFYTLKTDNNTSTKKLVVVK